ncbi:MAG TPA: flagellar hook-associated protein FlgL [Solirubrobacteraceae bacterium]|nr:flagellar hook-associated protein FlgL [Solirubrobacteraceae bacterium]
MIERITPLMTSAQILANINSLQDQLDNTQQELSTGRTINQPSDNPYGASLAISLNQDLSSLNSYANNVTDGTAWASAASTALQSIQSMVQRVQELTVEAANGSMSPTDLQATAAEVNQLIDAIKQTADTQYDGQYIFSGTATQTAPYSSATGDVYQGNTGAVVRQIGPGAQLQVNVDISSLLGSGQGAGDGLLLDTLRTIASDMQGATTADVADLSANQIANLQSNLSVLEQLQANVGAVQDRLQLASTRIQALQTSDTAALSNDEDANIASTYTTYSNEQAAFTAALKAGASIVQSSLMDFLTG